MCEVQDMHDMAVKEASDFEGVWRIVSNRDSNDRRLMVRNQKENSALVWCVELSNGQKQAVAVLPEDAREFCIGVLDLLDGQKPVVKDAWSPNEAKIGPED